MVKHTILIDEGDYNAMRSLLHDALIDLNKINDSVFKGMAEDKIARVYRTLTGENPKTCQPWVTQVFD